MVNKILEEIANKKEKYIKLYRRFPKKIEINKEMEAELITHFIYGIKLEKVFNMEVVINNDIKAIKEINVY